MARMNFTEFAGIVLTAVSVLVTILGVFIAVLAVWGYAQFRKTAKLSARRFIQSELSGGKLRKEIEEIVVAHISKELSSDRLRTILEARVDRLIYSDAERRATRAAAKDTLTDDDI